MRFGAASSPPSLPLIQEPVRPVGIVGPLLRRAPRPARFWIAPSRGARSPSFHAAIYQVRSPTFGHRTSGTSQPVAAPACSAGASEDFRANCFGSQRTPAARPVPVAVVPLGLPRRSRGQPPRGIRLLPMSHKSFNESGSARFVARAFGHASGLSRGWSFFHHQTLENRFLLLGFSSGFRRLLNLQRRPRGFSFQFLFSMMIFKPSFLCALFCATL